MKTGFKQEKILLFVNPCVGSMVYQDLLPKKIFLKC